MFQKATAQLSKINANCAFGHLSILSMKGVKPFPVYEIKLPCLKQDNQQKVRMKLNTIKDKICFFLVRYLSKRVHFLYCMAALQSYFGSLWATFEASLTRPKPISRLCSFSIPPEKVRTPLVSWCLQGV